VENQLLPEIHSHDDLLADFGRRSSNIPWTDDRIAPSEMRASWPQAVPSVWPQRLPTSVAVIDIDHFGRMSDLHGFTVANRVLAQLKLTARSLLRSNDLITRLGTDKLVLILPETKPQGALGICDRVRAQISSGPIIVGKLALTLTVSGGVAVLCEDGMPAAVEAATAALQVAKARGRDQLRMAA
jgi:diguanylate cyclase (GGDEF)-like protein